MKTNSLAFRLFVTAAAWVLVVLPVAGWIIFSRYHYEAITTFDSRITFFLTVVISDADEHSETGPNAPNNWGEGLFEITHSGWYWQIKPLDGSPGPTLRSRSLAGDTLALPSEHKIEPNEKEIRWGNLIGPGEQRVRIAEQVYVFGDGKAAQRYSVAVAGKLSEVEENLAAFRSQLIQALALAGIGLLAVTLFQIRFGLFPLSRVEQGLAAIRSGEASKLDGELPAEIKPLQQELNALIKSNQEIVERARTHVGNLAHALKTPLAVLINEARGDPSTLARKVTEQADTMTTQVNLYLDRARMAARIGVIGRVTEVRPVSESIMRALERIYRDKDLTYSLDCPYGTRFQGERQDLEEMLGNLLDNASKWARSRVSLVASATSQRTGDGAVGQLARDPGRGRRAGPHHRADCRAHRARPAPRRDQARLRPRPFHRRRPRLLLQRQVRAWPAPTSGGLSARLTLPLAA